MRIIKGKTLSKKMTKKELKLVKESSLNIFDWLKPNSKKEVITEDDDEEPMEVVDNEKEERLWRVQKRQQEWRTKQICSTLLKELIDSSIQETHMKIGREIMEEVANEAWEELEALHILELMEVGGAS